MLTATIQGIVPCGERLQLLVRARLGVQHDGRRDADPWSSTLAMCRACAESAATTRPPASRWSPRRRPTSRSCADACAPGSPSPRSVDKTAVRQPRRAEPRPVSASENAASTSSSPRHPAQRPVRGDERDRPGDAVADGIGVRRRRRPGRRGCRRSSRRGWAGRPTGTRSPRAAASAASRRRPPGSRRPRPGRRRGRWPSSAMTRVPGEHHGAERLADAAARAYVTATTLLVVCRRVKLAGALGTRRTLTRPAAVGRGRVSGWAGYTTSTCSTTRERSSSRAST